MKKYAFIAAIAAMCWPLADARAELIYGLTASNSIVRFDSMSPGASLGTSSISGLIAGDTLVGIDTRPANGQLYGVGVNGSTGRVYQINPISGTAMVVSTLSADPADTTPPTPFAGVSGTSFGVDFNPAVDRLRIVSNSGQNLRVNILNGLTQLDGLLAYATTDPNSGATPNIVASAYTNNIAGAPGGTSLYNLDVDLNQLVIQNPPNNGTLNSVALLGLGATIDAGFDISGQTGTAFVVLDGLNLSILNLMNGNVTPLGAIDTSSFIVDFAVAVPEPSSIALTTLAVGGLAIRARRRFFRS